MSKRKVGAGGYPESSDDSDASSQATSKKSKTSKPPTVNMMKKAAANSFLLPRLNTPAPSVCPSHPPAPIASSSSRAPVAKPVARTSHIPTPKDTPSFQKNTGLWDILSDSDVEKDSPISPIASLGQKTSVHVPAPPLAIPQPQETVRARSNVALERAVNDLGAQLQEAIHQSEDHRKEVDRKLDLVLETINRLVVSQQAVAAPATESLEVPLHPDAKPYHTNPPLTAALADTITKVVSSSQSRVKSKDREPSALLNSLRAFTRDTWYAMLGISIAKEVGPHFEDENKKPITLPDHARDPKTGYCRPYPHLTQALTKQMEWVPTYINRFQKTIPEGKSELSLALKDLSDFQIVVLLHDGPFKSAQNAWKQKAKTDAQIAEMQEEARRGIRAERKAITRGSYFHDIPSLKGPEYGFLSHPGYMSREVSDSEGRMITERPTHRSIWVDNLYLAVYRAELNKARSRPGTYRPPVPRVRPIEAPLPKLMISSGKKKETQYIADCAINKTWRKANDTEYVGCAYMISTKEHNKPDIRAFLEKYPKAAESDGDGDDEQEDASDAEPVGATGEGEGEGEGEGDGESEGEGMGEGMGEDDGSVGGADHTGVGDNFCTAEIGYSGKGKGKEKDLGEAGGEDENENKDERRHVYNGSGVGGLGLQGRLKSIDMSLIDPDLRPNAIPQRGNEQLPQVKPSVDARSTPAGVPPSALQIAPTPLPTVPSTYPQLPPHMIPPPMPPFQSQPAIETVNPSAKKPKKGGKRQPKNAEPGDADLLTLAQTASTSVPDAGEKRRPGRPRGSKNKPKDTPLQ